MENDRTDRPERVRLPQFDEPPGAGRPTAAWRTDEGFDDTGQSRGGGRAGGRRDAGVRRSLRVSNWTAAALIAGVAATTGYLAHAIPALGNGGTTGNGGTGAGTPAQHTQPTVAPSTPAVPGSVVTSGGSGAAGGGGRDN